MFKMEARPTRHAKVVTHYVYAEGLASAKISAIRAFTEGYSPTVTVAEDDMGQRPGNMYAKRRSSPKLAPLPDFMKYEQEEYLMKCQRTESTLLKLASASMRVYFDQVAKGAAPDRTLFGNAASALHTVLRSREQR
jgi:hypothetical protein